MARVYLTDEEREPAFCRLFAENLSGSALEWFAGLEERSIDNFTQFMTAFLKQYSVFIEEKTTEAALFGVSQKPDETLRSYIDRFKEIKAKIANPRDEVAIEALRRGLWYSTRFREEITVREPQTLDDALHRASAFARLEDETTALREKHRKERNPSGSQNSNSKKDSRKSGNVNAVESPKSSKKFEFDKEKFCDFHNKRGHSAEDCYTRAKAEAQKRESESKQDSEVEEETLPDKKENKQTKESNSKKPSQNKREWSKEPESPKTLPQGSRKRVEFILGELNLSGTPGGSALSPPPAPAKCLRSRI
ncbi:retrotransposon gag family protein, partial [Cutibacterium acnes]